MAKEKTTSNQVTPNPTGKGGFGDNPQNINLSGHWKKEDTPRFKLEQMMKMTEEELGEVVKDKNATYFERTLAVAMSQKDWKTIREMIHEVYGTPKSSVDVTSGGQQIQTVVKIIDERQNSRSSDTD